MSYAKGAEYTANHPASDLDSKYKEKLSKDLNNVNENIKEVLITKLYAYLMQASEVEHLLLIQYLYASFSLKKFPQEFEDYDSKSELRLSQIEKIRRWEASIIYVARQEMEHLAMVQNLIAILGLDPYLYRPNFPVKSTQVVLDKPLNIMPFSEHALEIFRYWEKPDRVHLPDPFRYNNIPKAIKLMGQQVKHPEVAIPFDVVSTKNYAWNEILNILNSEQSQSKTIKSIEELYTVISVYFYFLLEYRIINCNHFGRVVNEHFGFNITLHPIVDGKYYDYVHLVIQQIIQEGEGVWGVPPPLHSHFMVFQNILNEYAGQHACAVNFDPALPCVSNPTISTQTEFHNVLLPQNNNESPLEFVTNKVAQSSMDLFNKAYNIMIKLLFGFFKQYSINNTTGIHPPNVNAYFQTAFYPFMTMVLRPLGELVCRLPADEDYVPEDGKVPTKTAGPNFFFSIDQHANLNDKIAYFDVHEEMQYFTKAFTDMAAQAKEIGELCNKKGYHVANFKEQDARDFDVRFNYLSENFVRICQNFEAYWKGKIVAPIPSTNFQNFSEPFN